MDGHCTCGEIRYRLARERLFTHCCHCRWCQRGTGSAFALNALIETASLELRSGSPEIHIFTESRQPWVRLPDDVPSAEHYYRWREVWPKASQERRIAVFGLA